MQATGTPDAIVLHTATNVIITRGYLCGHDVVKIMGRDFDLRPQNTVQ
jgi:hypothetical protein